MTLCWRCGEQSDTVQRAICDDCRVQLMRQNMSDAAVSIGRAFQRIVQAFVPAIQKVTEAMLNLAKDAYPIFKAIAIENGTITSNRINTPSSLMEGVYSGTEAQEGSDPPDI